MRTRTGASRRERRRPIGNFSLILFQAGRQAGKGIWTGAERRAYDARAGETVEGGKEGGGGRGAQQGPQRTCEWVQEIGQRGNFLPDPWCSREEVVWLIPVGKSNPITDQEGYSPSSGCRRRRRCEPPKPNRCGCCRCCCCCCCCWPEMPFQCVQPLSFPLPRSSSLLDTSLHPTQS